MDEKAMEDFDAQMAELEDIPMTGEELTPSAEARVRQEVDQKNVSQRSSQQSQSSQKSNASENNNMEDDLLADLGIDVEELLKESQDGAELENLTQTSTYRPRGLLRQTWINERTSPEILQWEAELVEEIKRHIDEQQELIFETKTGTEGPQAALECNVYQLELDRINYILSSYLRTRLKKIQKYALHILTNDEQLARLSPAEVTYARGYIDLMERHYNVSFLSQIPKKFQDLITRNAETNMVPEPNLRDFVFLRVKDDLGAFDLGDDLEQDLNTGDIVAASYQLFQKLLMDEKVECI